MLFAFKKIVLRLYLWYQTTVLYRFRTVGSGSRLGRRLFVYPGKVSLGARCYIGAGTYLDGDITIGDCTMLAPNVAIVGGDHSFDVLGVAMRDTGREHWRQTIIGRDVWIGHSAIILNGCRIGDGAVVAAGAVVTKDVPSFAVVAGVPARFVRWRFVEADQHRHFSLLEKGSSESL